MKDRINALLEKHSITVESVFVPWSQSRNKAEKQPSLNWIVTVKQAGREIVRTDYSAGCGHAPSYKQSFGGSVVNSKIVAAECEFGVKCFWEDYRGKALPKGGALIPDEKRIKPDSNDVIHSLLLDSEVLNYSSYEDWAGEFGGEFGYDEDSRKGEQIYQACMKIALQFRRLGESVIAELREAFQDY